LGAFFFGLSQLVINSLVAAKKSRTISVIVVGSATLNLALNAVFIPWLGPIGAAYTTGISYAVFLLWSAIRVFQLEGISYRWERVIRTVLLVLLFYALAQALLSLATPLRIMLWICLILLYPISLRLAGVYAASDVQDLLRLVRNRLHRPRHHA
jgi:O-antigen/teichoic acid export membrane protein